MALYQWMFDGGYSRKRGIPLLPIPSINTGTRICNDEDTG